MCSLCWLEAGSPSDVPPNAPEIVALIEELYEMEGCGVGGPLHVELDDENIDVHPWVPEPAIPKERRWDVDYDEDAVEKAQAICDRMNLLTYEQRYAVVAQWKGYL